MAQVNLGIDEMKAILLPDHEDIFRAMTNKGVVEQRYSQWQGPRELYTYMEAVKSLTKALDPTDERMMIHSG